MYILSYHNLKKQTVLFIINMITFYGISMKKNFLLITSLIFSLIFFSCRSTAHSKNSAFDSDVIQIVNNMTIRQKIGQILMMNFRYCKTSEFNETPSSVTDYEDASGKLVKVAPLTSLNKTALTVLTDYHIGNVILFAENLTDTTKALYMTSQLQVNSTQNGDLPLIISVDQEGGRVNRIFQTATFPPAKTIGSTGNPDLAFTEGQYMAEQLLALGINLNFAPVCDVDSNPKNPVIGNRSFSSNPKTAGTFASKLQQGLRSKKVIPCAKHFPGHGDTDVDSHIGLPLVNRTKSEWKKLEAVPFKMNIDEGIPVIMTAHIQYPGLDSSKVTADKTLRQIKRPATLSKKILTDILRGELGFDGVICTDAMDMKAISKNFSEATAVIEALNAGADMICNPISIIEKSDIARIEKMYSEIEEAINSGKLLKSRLDNAVLRIVQLKKDYGILEKKYDYPATDDYKNAKAILNNHKFYSFNEKLKAD